jgi:hypothetical protein
MQYREIRRDDKRRRGRRTVARAETIVRVPSSAIVAIAATL